jgi:hypothetical protein
MVLWNYTHLEGLTAVIMKNAVFWVGSHVALVRTDISEEYIASTFTVKKSAT